MFIPIPKPFEKIAAPEIINSPLVTPELKDILTSTFNNIKHHISDKVRRPREFFKEIDTFANNLIETYSKLSRADDVNKIKGLTKNLVNVLNYKVLLNYDIDVEIARQVFELKDKYSESGLFSGLYTKDMLKKRLEKGGSLVDLFRAGDHKWNKELLDRTSSGALRSVAKNEHATPDILDILARSKYKSVKKQVALHPNISEETAKYLAEYYKESGEYDEDSHIPLRVLKAIEHYQDTPLGVAPPKVLRKPQAITKRSTMFELLEDIDADAYKGLLIQKNPFFKDVIVDSKLSLEEKEILASLNPLLLIELERLIGEEKLIVILEDVISESKSPRAINHIMEYYMYRHNNSEGRLKTEKELELLRKAVAKMGGSSISNQLLEAYSHVKKDYYKLKSPEDIYNFIKDRTPQEIVNLIHHNVYFRGYLKSNINKLSAKDVQMFLKKGALDFLVNLSEVNSFLRMVENPESSALIKDHFKHLFPQKPAEINIKEETRAKPSLVDLARSTQDEERLKSLHYILVNVLRGGAPLYGENLELYEALKHNPHYSKKHMFVAPDEVLAFIKESTQEDISLLFKENAGAVHKFLRSLGETRLESTLKDMLQSLSEDNVKEIWDLALISGSLKYPTSEYLEELLKIKNLSSEMKGKIENELEKSRIRKRNLWLRRLNTPKFIDNLEELSQKEVAYLLEELSQKELAYSSYHRVTGNPSVFQEAAKAGKLILLLSKMPVSKKEKLKVFNIELLKTPEERLEFLEIEGIPADIRNKVEIELNKDIQSVIGDKNRNLESLSPRFSAEVSKRIDWIKQRHSDILKVIREAEDFIAEYTEDELYLLSMEELNSLYSIGVTISSQLSNYMSSTNGLGDLRSKMHDVLLPIEDVLLLMEEIYEDKEYGPKRLEYLQEKVEDIKENVKGYIEGTKELDHLDPVFGLKYYMNRVRDFKDVSRYLKKTQPELFKKLETLFSYVENSIIPAMKNQEEVKNIRQKQLEAERQKAVEETRVKLKTLYNYDTIIGAGSFSPSAIRKLGEDLYRLKDIRRGKPVSSRYVLIGSAESLVNFAEYKYGKQLNSGIDINIGGEEVHLRGEQLIRIHAGKISKSGSGESTVLELDGKGPFKLYTIRFKQGPVRTKTGKEIYVDIKTFFDALREKGLVRTPTAFSWQGKSFATFYLITTGEI